MRRFPPRSLLAALLVAVMLAACASIEDVPPAQSVQPLQGLGPTGFEVTARDEQARAWFAHGMRLTYAFEHEEAARVFRAALARDPSCAMCAWGVALALGPNINKPDRGPERDIRRFVARARQAAAGASARERALIDAMAVRYGAAEERAQKTYEALGAAVCSARPAGARPDAREFAYVAAMGDVVARFPDDPDVVALYADAVMSTMPWDWWDTRTGRPYGRVGDVIARLAAAARAHPQHTGVLHFFVHLAEHSPDPRQAETAADALGTVAPEAPHLVHMGSHIYKNVGRFADGTRANERALQAQLRFDAALVAQGGRGGGRWDGHHLHFLWYSALMEGRADLSRATALEYARRFGGLGDGFAEYARLLPLATLVRLQRWGDVLSEPPPNQGLGLLEGYDAYARGMAYAHTGRLPLARAELDRLARVVTWPTLQRARIHGAPMPASMLALARDTLAGTLARFEGRHDEAVGLLRKAAAADDDFGNDPPLLGGGVRLALAGTLLQAGRLDEAAVEIAEAVRLNGPSAWSHQGMAQVAAARGARAEKRRHEEAARAAWSQAEGAMLPRL